MKPIPKLALVSYVDGQPMVHGVAPESDWVFELHPPAVQMTVLLDGIAVMIDERRIPWKTYERKRVRPEDNASPWADAPRGWQDADVVNERTGVVDFAADWGPPESDENWHGWVVVDEEDPDFERVQAGITWLRKNHRPAYRPGLFALVGSRIAGNPYHLASNEVRLLPQGGKHGEKVDASWPLDLGEVHSLMIMTPAKGILFEETGGAQRRAKVLRQDFGLRWPLDRGHFKL